MPGFSKESLEKLRDRIDLYEILSPYVKLKSAGSAYKALCPFHDEKTPSFTFQKGDKHYHCFGCGAHGDAISFMMNYLKMTFQDAVENLAEKFQVVLEEGSNEDKGPPKKKLKEALEIAARFYHFYLLHTEEGKEGLEYLYQRGIDLDFIRTYRFGFAPKESSYFQSYMREKKIPKELLSDAGLVKSFGKDFFTSRIMIPILDPVGSVIGFSSRKIREDQFGPKYINTPETPLFKKSKLLFGLSYSRKEIARSKKALIVEGQIDALRLIYSGIKIAVASQGTSFTESHVKELIQVGAKHVYIAFDADTAGQNAAEKTGDLFQKEGIDVNIVKLPEKSDPDTILMEKGIDVWMELVQKSTDYLTFLVDKYRPKDATPAKKNDLVTMIARRIKNWDHPLMVHESLRKLANLTHTPESMIGIEEEAPISVIKKSSSVSHQEVNFDRVLEADLLRWIFLAAESHPDILKIAKLNLQEGHFKISCTRRLFKTYFKAVEEERPRDLLSLTLDLENAEDQLFLSEMLQKKINQERAVECFTETVKQILERRWMEKREEIKDQILSGRKSEDEVMELAKDFDRLKKERPTVQLPTSQP